MNPISAFLEWYDSILPEHRTHLASYCLEFITRIVGLSLQDVRAIDGAVAVERFRSWITGFAEDEVELIPVILMLREMVDFLFSDRFTEEGWDRNKDWLEGASEFARSHGSRGMEGLADESLRRIPLSRRQWIRTGESWNELKARHLTNERLKAWFNRPSQN